MLSELHITGLGVIDDAVLELHPGLTVVTGETGAGKTMVVTALGLATGGRADAHRVRTGAARATVEARFLPPAGSPAVGVTQAAGGELDDDGSLITVRTVTADGRSRAHVGGRSAPLATLSEVTDPLVAIHGQSEAISLLRPAQQRAVLDRFAGLTAEISDYRRLRSEWQAARRELTDRLASGQQRAQREQLLQIGLAEIAAVNPLPGEDAELIAEARRLENADALRASAADAQTALDGSDADPDVASAVGQLTAARRALESAGDEKLRALSQALREAGVLLTDVGMELSAYLDELDADPERLQTIMERQAVLRTLTRRYGADVDAVLDWAESARVELASLDTSDEAIAALREQEKKLASAVVAAGKRLTKARTARAEELGAAATAELANLAMGRATLRVAVTQTEVAPGHADALKVGGRYITAGPDGFDTVELLLTAHRGAPELPIQKGASGGELSRVMLSLEVVLAEADPVGTLVFDEVDAGVGGRAATEIGALLARLARTHQVVVVTHLAQVAAYADRQLVVDATEDGAIRSSSVRAVEGDLREAELARMLGGTVGASARQHAAELVTAARTRRKELSRAA
ncbi:DNA repair protein RecN [Nakamurella deserti]|uniref:DNA repair protein RecN n=1 Tax=Nakamurella deserti TaxID=2164074 RepID=UPI000DBEAA81|nr:DNA repair protein RecN [Nakamurella deserti]